MERVRQAHHGVSPPHEEPFVAVWRCDLKLVLVQSETPVFVHGTDFTTPEGRIGSHHKVSHDSVFWARRRTDEEEEEAEWVLSYQRLQLP